MAAIVTGGAGFVAANLIPKLLDRGDHVLALDSCTRGSFDYLGAYAGRQEFRAEVVDLTDLEAFRVAVSRHEELGPFDCVWHLAANSDIPAGVSDPNVDLRDTFMTTFNTLRVIKDLGIRRINFASSSAIYGDQGARVLTEDIGPLLPISNYGAMKLASEAAISAASEQFLDHALIFRFPNVVGAPATHGVILDFVKRLRADPSQLTVLGNGTQQKSYLHVSDLVGAMMFLDDQSREKIGLYNIGPADEGVTVRQIAEETVAQVAAGAKIYFGSEARGWVGDVPRFFYSIGKITALGWRPQLTSLEAIRRAISEIAAEVPAR